MGVSNLAELRRTLRQTGDTASARREGDLASAFRTSKDRISTELRERGRSEFRDSRGNAFVIERKKV